MEHKCEAGSMGNKCGKKARFKIMDIECEYNETSIFWVCNECLDWFINQKEDNPHYIILDECSSCKRLKK